MYLLLFLGLLFLLILYILWTPIILFIDTNTNEYYIQLKGLAKASIEKDKVEFLKIKLTLFFFNFYFFPFGQDKKNIQKKNIKKASSKKGNKRISIKTGLRLLKSFKVKRFLLDIDTYDCICNAKLYPIFAFLNYKIGGFNINFEGRNKMVLLMENRPIYIIKSFINV